MIHKHFESKLKVIQNQSRFQSVGQVKKVTGLIVEAKGLNLPLGTLCEVFVEKKPIELEVIGFSEDVTYLMPIETMGHIYPNIEIKSLNRFPTAPVGFGLLGRILDGQGKPIDGKGPLVTEGQRELEAVSVNPLERPPLREPLDVGIRAINGLIPVAKGQRMGLFAGSGVGKSVLLGMMTSFTKADVIVIGLIGERGREVREFIDKNIGQGGLAKSVIVASPSDCSPVQRVNGALMACTIGEYFREQGKDVLLIMDSLTRFAHAKRQIALSIGEPPAQRGYTPSVFFDLAQLIERAGLVSEKGSMTAFYTVLAEGDDLQDPIVDTTRSLLDGHIVLSRAIAEMGTYPAIDVEASISRAMTDIVKSEQMSDIFLFKRYHAIYQENKDLITVGAYQKGTNPELDLSVKFHQVMNHYIKQSFDAPIYFEPAVSQLRNLFNQNSIEPAHGTA